MEDTPRFKNASRILKLSLLPNPKDLYYNTAAKFRTSTLPPIKSRNVNITERLRFKGETGIKPLKVYNNVQYDEWQKHWALKPLRHELRKSMQIKTIQRKMKNPQTYICHTESEDIEEMIELKLRIAAKSLLS